MLEYLQKDSLFYIIPENIDYAGEFSFKEKEDGSFDLFNKNKININVNEKFEAFVNSTEGIIYFISTVKNVENNILNIDIPQDYEILQRRENKRVKINSVITIQNKSIKEEVLLVDISVGGIKIITDRQLDLNTDYEVIFNFDNITSSFIFTPNRISVNENANNYQISGQIVSISAKDKISLIQYCYKKLYEQSNRK